jgi:hypothetical protein
MTIGTVGLYSSKRRSVLGGGKGKKEVVLVPGISQRLRGPLAGMGRLETEVLLFALSPRGVVFVGPGACCPGVRNRSLTFSKSSVAESRSNPVRPFLLDPADVRRTFTNSSGRTDLLPLSVPTGAVIRRQAHLHKSVSKLPLPWEGLIGKNAVRLSANIHNRKHKHRRATRDPACLHATLCLRWRQ